MTTTHMQRNGQPPVPIRRASKTHDGPLSIDAATTHQKHTPDSQELPKRQTRRVKTKVLPQRRENFFRRHWMPLATGMLLTYLLYCMGTTYVLPFASDVIDHWNYGEEHISQCDANVGHHGTSRFVAQYWHGQVVVIEFPGGNTKQAHVYLMHITHDNDQTPRSVTLSALRQSTWDTRIS